MDNVIIIILAVVVLFYLLSKSKFERIETVYNKNYNTQKEPPSCDYNAQNRVYPSGKVPGSYLGLSNQEKENLLVRFLEYNGSIPQFQTT